ncbi:tryptophan--tRNA ligase [Polyangium aurulentum]|uniref:tryptophan--tRNA ligase n=1 Tax=Polyangium aurulentum TaxID=2567896 RepID=UPI0010AEA0DD|nr:tryptophan--tRNA ligase [Polyangium aurulentum]UQA57763.1 tryptophan--tRNA ligase [Polyangium aurulentum]
MNKKTILTGIKSSGRPHLGNYIGAIKPALALAQNPAHEALYFIADYHALTTLHDPKEMRHSGYEVAATWLALGLDPARVVFFRQSDVPEIFELAWVLACFTSKGLMNRAHAYKAMVQKNQEAGVDEDAGVHMGLYEYPILMASDILLFDSHLVPVGKDQAQHIEMAADIAGSFNAVYGPVLTIPAPYINEATATVPGLDGRKMSKSYDNVIPLFGDPKKLRKLVMRIVTDSTPPEAPKDPATSSIFQLYESFATPEQIEALRGRYQTGLGWGEAKQALYEVLEAFLEGPRKVYDDLMAHPDIIEGHLAAGRERARTVATATMDRVRKAVGVGRA